MIIIRHYLFIHRVSDGDFSGLGLGTEGVHVGVGGGPLLGGNLEEKRNKRKKR